jgi:hypothetical protein
MKLMVRCRQTTTSAQPLPRTRSHRSRASIAVVAAIGIGFALTAIDHHHTSTVSAAPPSTPQLTANDSGYAQGGLPATRRPVKPSVTVNGLPIDVSFAIRGMATAVDGCTHTVVGSSIITAAHCHPAGFSTEGDIAWEGAKPVWVDPALISAGATIYAVGYPRANPGPQSFALTTLGIRSVPMEGKSIEVLMAFGEGVPCTPGSSGMIAWVTLDNQMVPIGPMSVYSTNPAITGLPAGQYVCGFAV